MKRVTAFALMLSALLAQNELPKEATEITKRLNQETYSRLDFSNTQDFQNAKKNFIGNMEGNLSFDFINSSKSPSSVNPSLWRQAQLNNISGLFEVTKGIYQVRGFDLANITFIKGDKGWIVVDPLTTTESATKAIKLFRKYMGNEPFSGVIFTHSHLDHFGGIQAILNDKIIKDIPIVAPQGFLQEASSENLLAGNAMSRRASYMYGVFLPKNSKGIVDAGLGKGLSKGNSSIVAPTKTISKSGEKYVIDGVEFEFLMAQNTEAPSEFMFYIPKYKSASSAEVINHTLHNLSTLRGAKTRNSLLWVDAINASKDFLASRTEVLFGSHHWPTWGQKNIDAFITKHADLYQFLHDQTLRLANQGKTYLEIAEELEIPAEISKEFYNRGYYGSYNHDIKAIYDFYFGAWWDGNPANLYKLPSEKSAKLYVEYMGGEEAILKKAQKSFENGEYRFVVEVLNHLIFANPKNQKAKNLSADAMEQLGYQSESAVWRSYFLSGAYELRNGVPYGSKSPIPLSPDLLKQLKTQDILNYLAVRLNPQKTKNITFRITNEDGDFYVTTKNNVLKYQNYTQQPVDFTIKASHLEILRASLSDNEININTTDKKKTKEFFDMLDQFDFWFNIVTP